MKRLNKFILLVFASLLIAEPDEPIVALAKLDRQVMRDNRSNRGIIQLITCQT